MKHKYVEKVRAYFSRPDKPAFSIHELRALGIPYSYAKLLLHHLTKKGEIIRIRRGWYTFHPDPLVFIYTLPPGTAYYGLGFAAHIHGAWAQVPNPEILTYAAPRKIRTGTHQLLDANIIVRRISPKLFGGYTLIRHGNWLLPVSTPEKTLLDILYYKYPFTDEIIEELAEKIDTQEITRLLHEHPYPKRVKNTIKKLTAKQRQKAEHQYTATK